jgi:hypothetical protein
VFNDIHDLQENAFTDGEKFVELRRDNIRGDLVGSKNSSALTATQDVALHCISHATLP